MLMTLPASVTPATASLTIASSGSRRVCIKAAVASTPVACGLAQPCHNTGEWQYMRRGSSHRVASHIVVQNPTASHATYRRPHPSDVGFVLPCQAPASADKHQGDGERTAEEAGCVMTAVMTEYEAERQARIAANLKVQLMLSGHPEIVPKGCLLTTVCVDAGCAACEAATKEIIAQANIRTGLVC